MNKLKQKIQKEAFFMEEAEGYLAIGYKENEQDEAIKAINRIEIKDMGMDKSEIYLKEDLKFVKISITKDEYGDDFYSWGDDKVKCDKCNRPYDNITTGFVGYI